MKSANQNTAVVIIDIINTFDFPGGDELLKNTKKILPDLLKLRDNAKKNDIPIIYVNDHYGIWQSDFTKVGEYCRNEKNKEIIDQMMPDADDYFLIKPKHSGFYGTALESLLNELGVNHIIFAGIAGDICVLFTANDAHMREYDISVPKNCTASNEQQQNDRALKLMEDKLSASTNPI
ncbi:isochorismatase family cysteine hydrolase [Sediminibacillus albus]|uniref:Nicotinamidase-related amidase n=1 Tax=Sediminibacillus albus TaxID=407036 RepID=A0A1G9A9A2_9BACI|nr:isochorismatase family cysteine hydrolase [Sediminibacillus albus]SDK23843.1 Nicotinamidase-related amidase [Sediminibacillus albus]